MSTFRSSRRVCVIALLLAVAACQDRSMLTSPRNMQPRMTISDGAHNGGNGDVFFLPPLVPDPSNAPGYGDPFQPGLPVAFRICTVVNGNGCLPDNSNLVRSFPPSAVKMSLTDQQYQVNWDTKADALDPARTYRIEVRIGSKTVAFADVDVVSTGSQLRNVNTGLYIPLLDDRTLPIKVRVEQGWNCTNHTSCVTQVVTNTPPPGQPYTRVVTSDSENAAAFPANWFDPTVAGTDQVLVTIEDVTQQLNPNGGTADCAIGKTVMLTSGGHCVRFTTDPRVTFMAPVTVGVCLIGNPGDTRQLLMKYDYNERPTFLQNVAPPLVCPEPHGSIGSRQSGFGGRLASALSAMGSFVTRLIAPKTAYAIHLGVGGLIDAGDGFSLIASGLPVTMSAVAGDGQSGPVSGTLPVPVQVMLTTPHPAPAPLAGATVVCTVSSGGGSLGGAPFVAVQTDANGIATCPAWTLGAAPGANTLRVTTPSADSLVYIGSGTTVATAGALTFTATAVSGYSISGVLNYSTTALDGFAIGVGDGIDWRQQPAQRVTTAGGGHYAFSGLAAGTHWIAIYGGGVYADTVVQIVGLSDKTGNLTLNLDLPKKLSLTWPEDGDIVEAGVSLGFLWSFNPDAQTYSFAVNSNSPDQLVLQQNVTQPDYWAPASAFTAGASYRWQVSARDAAGHLVGTYVRMSTFTAMHGDQVSDPASGTGYSLGNGETGSMYQSFRPYRNSISAVKIRVRAGGSFPAAGVSRTLRIRSGTIDGPIVASITVPIAGPRTAGETFYIAYILGTPIPVTIGATYVLDWDASGGEILSWLGAASPYSEGSAISWYTGLPIPDVYYDFVTYWY